jgi:hypothetical protein
MKVHSLKDYDNRVYLVPFEHMPGRGSPVYEIDDALYERWRAAKSALDEVEREITSEIRVASS